MASQKDAPLSEHLRVEAEKLSRAYGAGPVVELLVVAAEALTALQATVHRLEAEKVELQLARIGDSEIIGRWMCECDDLKAQLTALSPATAEQRLMSRAQVEDIAAFVEHLRLDYVSQLLSVKTVARSIRERYLASEGSQ